MGDFFAKNREETARRSQAAAADAKARSGSPLIPDTVGRAGVNPLNSGGAEARGPASVFDSKSPTYTHDPQEPPPPPRPQQFDARAVGSSSASAAARTNGGYYAPPDASKVPSEAAKSPLAAALYLLAVNFGA